MRRRGVLLLLAACLAAQTSSPKLYPVDEGSQSPSLQAFRRQLMEALAKKDAAFVKSILDPQVEVSLGDDVGPESFVQFWQLDRPETSHLWEELSAVLSLGGRLIRESAREEFWAPYIFTDFPDGLDPFSHGVITGSDVPVRRAPDPAAEVIMRLSYDIVRMPPDSQTPQGWVKIATLQGREGYVRPREVRSPVAHRAGFVQDRGGDWRLAVFVAGD
jgi:hypothetical protein